MTQETHFTFAEIKELKRSFELDWGNNDWDGGNQEKIWAEAMHSIASIKYQVQRTGENERYDDALILRRKLEGQLSQKEIKEIKIICDERMACSIWARG